MCWMQKKNTEKNYKSPKKRKDKEMEFINLKLNKSSQNNHQSTPQSI